MAQVEFQSEFETNRRSYERTPVALFGRCLMPSQLEIPCQAIDISPGDVGVISAHTPELGDAIILYLDHVGRLEGQCARVFEGGFAITIDCTSRKREKLSARIEWLKAHKQFLLDDQRAHDRIEPENPNSELRLSDGRHYPIKIIDISLSGAAIECDVKPAIGSKVSLAGMSGAVVRHFAEGVGIRFAVVADRTGLFVDKQ